MNDFFTDENKENTLKVLNTWLGTPYRHMQMAKGRGCDCALFMAGMFIELGIFRKVKYQSYTKDWYIFSKTEVVINGIKENVEQNGNNVEVKFYKPNEEIKFFDVLLFKMSKKSNLSNHLGLLYSKSQIVHCIDHKGVIIEDLKNYQDKISHIVRILKWD